MTTASFSNNPDLVQAILDDRLSEWASTILDDPASDHELRQIASQALETCAAIRSSTEGDAEQLTVVFRAAGIDSTATTSDQRHTLHIDVDPGDAEDAIAVLKDAGYQAARDWVGAAARSFLRFGGETILTRSGTHTSVAVLRWRRPTPGQSKLRSLIARVINPTPADWAIVDLPERLWWAYGALRPFRLVAERLGLASDEHGDLEPFLVTPDALLDPLFAVAEIDDSDVFADVGCGDGRIVVAAVQQRGCRAIGIDQSAATAAAARRRVAEAELSDRIRIIHANAQDTDLSEATVALFFVPMAVATRLVPTVLQQLAPGGRIVLHEQSRLATTLPSPIDSTAIIASDAVTVAHRWDQSYS